MHKKNQINKLALNYEGNKVACAHQAGTIINIYDTMMNAGKELFKLRIKNTCNIETLEFSKDSRILAAITSPFKYNKNEKNIDIDSKTVHIFDLEDSNINNNNDQFNKFSKIKINFKINSNYKFKNSS